MKTVCISYQYIQIRNGTNMEIRIPAPAQEILRKLNENGYEAYVVGGCVRDMLLGREPGDWDITTSALPEQVKQVFRRTVDTGIKHGTVTVMVDKEGYEVTTYRIDGNYSDGRHPDSVQFTPNLVEDLKRRDFTINAMAYNSQTGFVDEFGGVEDLEHGIIRCVGEPMDRFTEDALRILRAIRFSAQLGFSIEEQTFRSICVIAPNIAHVSKERIQVELTKLLLSRNPGHMAMVYGTGISPYVSETFCHAYAGEGIPAIPSAIPAVRHMRWAAFLRECSPDMAADILRDLKLDNDTIYRVRTLVEWQGRPFYAQKPCIRRVMSRMEPELFDNLLEFKRCLAEAFSSGKMSPAAGKGIRPMEPRPETAGTLAQVRDLAGEIRHMGDCISLKTLAVTGHDIMEAGVKPGKEVGATLSRLLDMVLEDPGCNTKEYLLGHLAVRPR